MNRSGGVAVGVCSDVFSDVNVENVCNDVNIEMEVCRRVGVSTDVCSEVCNDVNTKNDAYRRCVP